MQRWHLLEDLDEAERLGATIIGAGVRRARLWAGLSQRQLGWRVGITQSAVSRLENGRLGGIRFRTLCRIFAVLEAPPGVAFPGEPSAPRRRLPGEPRDLAPMGVPPPVRA
jgi:transcriptional regulator with XRE-family HTH domain